MNDLKRNNERKTKHDERIRLVKRRRMIAVVLGLIIILAAVLIISAAVKRGKKADTEPQAAVEQEDISGNETGDGSSKTGESATDAVRRVLSGLKKEDGSSESEEKPLIASESSIERTVLISAAGDCTLGTDEQFDYDTSFNAMYDDVGDPGYFLGGVKEVFAEDDLTIVNFEGTLSEGGEREDKTYAFRGRPEFAQILTEGSVEAANLANNHSFDYGEEAYEDTKMYLDDAGVVTFGYDRSQVIDVNGVKVGLIGIMELFEGMDSEEDLMRELDTVKSEGAELIIVTFHWGDEGQYYPTDVQRALGHAAIDNGADLVIGHHPHVLEGIEEYNGSYIVYSLGNFCFGGNKDPGDKDTMIFQQKFTITDEGVQKNDDINIIPCLLSSHYDYNDYRPMVLEDDEASRVLSKIEEMSDF